VIIETGILTEDEIIRCCKIYTEAGADYLKTSTGYAEKGASVKDVMLLRQQLPPTAKIKASGGIRSYEFARQLIEAGADRLGTSSGLQIISGHASDASAGY
jgi:deoxyribose-phosphate aldolase